MSGEEAEVQRQVPLSDLLELAAQRERRAAVLAVEHRCKALADEHLAILVQLAKRCRHVFSGLICRRDLLIDTLEKRFAKFPDPDTIPLRYFAEPGRYDHRMGLYRHKIGEFETSLPMVTFTHKEGLGFGHLSYRKKLGDNRATELPYWGRAEDVLALYQPVE